MTMFGRDQRKVHPRSVQTSKVSQARTLKILSSIPRDKPDLIHNLQDDWKAVERLATDCVKYALQTQLRAYGHQAITEDVSLLLQKPGEYPAVAHHSYIKRATTETEQVLCRASDIRRLLANIEFSDEVMRAIMRKAAEQVERTPDEPKLVVREVDDDLAVTFAT
jgi:hypothetical protein